MHCNYYANAWLWLHINYDFRLHFISLEKLWVLLPMNRIKSKLTQWINQIQDLFKVRFNSNWFNQCWHYFFVVVYLHSKNLQEKKIICDISKYPLKFQWWNFGKQGAVLLHGVLNMPLRSYFHKTSINRNMEKIKSPFRAFFFPFSAFPFSSCLMRKYNSLTQKQKMVWGLVCRAFIL